MRPIAQTYTARNPGTPYLFLETRLPWAWAARAGVFAAPYRTGQTDHWQDGKKPWGTCMTRLLEKRMLSESA